MRANGNPLTKTTLGGLAQAWQFGGDWGAWREALSADLWMRARVLDSTVSRFRSRDPADYM